MNSFPDSLEEAALKIKNLGEQAAETIKPALKQGLNRAAENAMDFCETVRPKVEKGVDRAVQTAKSTCARLKESVRGDREKPSAHLNDELNQAVQEQLEKIRASQNVPSPFSDLFSNKKDPS